MRETQRGTLAIVRDMLTGDFHKVWRASCEICSLSQNHRRIMRFLPFQSVMKITTRHINPKGRTVPKNPYLIEAFRIIDFHKKENQCPCRLLGQDSNPGHLAEDGYFELLKTVYWEGRPSVVDYSIVRCKQCGTVHKVWEREYHYTWWEWTAL